MLAVSELATAIVAGVGVVAISVGATVYVAGEGDASQASLAGATGVSSGSYRFEMGDAYFPCRDHIREAVPYRVQNVNVDSHSSRYDDKNNDNVVYIDLELVGASGEMVSRSTQDAQIVCRVSAASNEITSFQLRR